MADYSYDAEGRFRWGSRAAGLLISRADTQEILLTLRSGDVLDPYVWGIPGGRVEPGQRLYEAARTETIEELGSLPRVKRLGDVTMTSGAFSFTTFFVAISGQAAERWAPELNWENDDWGWFARHRLPFDLHPGVAWALEHAPV